MDLNMDCTPLRIVHWNAETLRRKKLMLSHFLREQRVDLLLVSETDLREGESYTLPGYIGYRKDEKSPEGVTYRGLTVFVKRSVVHQAIPHVEFQTMYALGVLVHYGGHDLRVFATYMPPTTVLKIEELRSLLLNPTPTVVAGDFNAKHTAWHSTKICPRGRRLLADSVDHDYEVVSPDEPTHYSYQGAVADVIDLVAYRGLRTPPEQIVFADLPSDHRPVLLVLKELPSRVTLAGRMSRTNWDSYANELTAPRPCQRYPVLTTAFKQSTTCGRPTP